MGCSRSVERGKPVVATWAIRGGASTALVARVLGHRDVRTTEQFYVHLAAADMEHSVRYSPLVQLGL